MIGLLMLAAAVALVAYAPKGPNAVWGGALLGVAIGFAIAVWEPGFSWWTIGESGAIGVVAGLFAELLGLLGRKLRG